jgi:hypothetical protein
MPPTIDDGPWHDSPTPPSARRQNRPWIGVHFVCAAQYLRVFRNAAGTHYLARCPRCAKCTRFRVGPGGVSHRFFEVSCAGAPLHSNR